MTVELYKLIKTRREEIGMSQEELAHKLGYTSRSTIAKIESGTNDIPKSRIVAFANALNISLVELLGWTKEAELSFEYHLDMQLKLLGYGIIFDEDDAGLFVNYAGKDYEITLQQFNDVKAAIREAIESNMKELLSKSRCITNEIKIRNIAAHSADDLTSDDIKALLEFAKKHVAKSDEDDEE